MRSTQRFLAALSGEHLSLPQAEFKAALEAEGYRFNIVQNNGRLLILDVYDAIPLTAAIRCGMLTCLASELFTCSFTTEQIIPHMKDIDLTFNSKVKTFAVRIIRLGSGTPGNALFLESMLGKMIAKITKLTVNLDNPDLNFIGFIANNVFALGIKIYERPIKFFSARMPKNRIAIHPSTMDSKLARCMVNLSRAQKNKLLLDPFCGVGGILLEAASIGCKVIGCDVSKKMALGSYMNLKSYKYTASGILVADIAHTPIQKIVAVATDPPYGTAATTLKRGVRIILRDFLHEAEYFLDLECYAALAAPKGVGLIELVEDTNFKVVETHEIYVHKKLTRQIISIKRI
jgi:tRNA (guanine10-N2)-dimethyltransferase